MADGCRKHLFRQTMRCHIGNRCQRPLRSPLRYFHEKSSIIRAVAECGGTLRRSVRRVSPADQRTSGAWCGREALEPAEGMKWRELTVMSRRQFWGWTEVELMPPEVRALEGAWCARAALEFRGGECFGDSCGAGPIAEASSICESC